MVRLVSLLLITVIILALTGCASPSAQVEPVTREVTVIVPQTVTVPQTVMVRETVEVPVTVVVTATSEPTARPEPTATVEPTPEQNALIPSRGTYKHEHTIKEEFDRFSGATSVRADPNPTKVYNGERNFSVGYSYKGTTPTIPDVVVFSFWSVAEDWQYLKCHSVALLVDGEQMPLESEHDGEVMSPKVLEMVHVPIDVDRFLQIVNAKKVEGQICNDEFVFTDKQMEAMRDVASRMQP